MAISAVSFFVFSIPAKRLAGKSVSEITYFASSGTEWNVKNLTESITDLLLV